jgi:hypothetical protein
MSLASELLSTDFAREVPRPEPRPEHSEDYCIQVSSFLRPSEDEARLWTPAAEEGTAPEVVAEPGTAGRLALFYQKVTPFTPEQ